ncbi:hypothetical protein OAU81_00515 [bacterium]|nr:hypothetical protein [bacterium]
MIVARPTLVSLLQQKVLELKYTRRIQRPDRPATRRMLCTNNQQLLMSENGLSVLRYKPTGGASNHNHSLHNTVPTWDIMVQDYRTVSADNCDVITVFEPDDSWWTYFNESILPMNADQKLTFLNS